jgi:hypothetical protein
MRRHASLLKVVNSVQLTRGVPLMSKLYILFAIIVHRILWSLSFTGLSSFLGSKKGKNGAKIAKRFFFCSFCLFLPFLLPESAQPSSFARW